jgi:hypothetical protein
MKNMQVLYSIPRNKNAVNSDVEYWVTFMREGIWLSSQTM